MESFQKILTLLNPDGYILLHYPKNITALDTLVLKSLLKTFEAAGAHVAKIRKRDDDRSPEEIIVASKTRQLIGSRDFRLTQVELPRLQYVYTAIFDRDIDYSSGQVLSDERNILELLQFESITELRDKGRSHRRVE